jgi:mono/diheme cytochrome c family protein
MVQGRGMMPRFGDSLSPQEIQAVVAYLHTL